MDRLEILEILPPCIWISSWMCRHHCCLNFLQLRLVVTKPLSQSFLSSSSPPLIPCSPVAASSSWIFLQFSEQNMYWTITPLRSTRNFLSIKTLFAQNGFRTREIRLIYPSAAICPDEFQNAQRPMFLSYLLVRVFKFIDLRCVGMGISWSLWISSLYCLYISVHVPNLMKTAGLALKLLEMLTNLISSLITNSWERFVMPAKQVKCTYYPRGDGRE